MPYAKFHNSKIKDYYPNPFKMLAKACYNVVYVCLLYAVWLFVVAMLLGWFLRH